MLVGDKTTYSRISLLQPPLGLDKNGLNRWMVFTERCIFKCIFIKIPKNVVLIREWSLQRAVFKEVSHVRQGMLTLPEHPMSPFNGGFMLFLFYLLIPSMSGQAFYWFWFCLLWYGLTLMLTYILLG